MIRNSRCRHRNNSIPKPASGPASGAGTDSGPDAHTFTGSVAMEGWLG
ncbi:hypothetical protein [Youngiibacter fragilis]|uniref:Uncharacterized protein n=1 Tax=Youngiibacter fragilis 232.1 TaxID=994573 RepID=V7I4I7_9CLOT|nr:hypothetical protein [Youngiibacter fragilis]ETA79912.1 hypothetical protein T472_0215445 [Youngiibacter fragilis 232.1]